MMGKNNTLRKIMFGFRKAFSMLPSSKDRIKVYMLWVACLFNYAISMLHPILQKWITDGAASLLTSNHDYSLLIVSLIIMLITIMISYYMRKYMNAWSNNVSAIISDSISSELMKKSVRLKYSYFENDNTFNEMSSVSSNIPQKIANLLTWSTVPPILGGIISLIFTAVTLCFINPIIAIMVSIGNILSIYFYGKRVKDNYFLKKEQIPQARLANSYASTLTSRKTQKEVKMFKSHGYFLLKWERYSNEMAIKKIGFALKYTSIQFLTDLIAITFKIGALGFCLYLIINEQTSIGSFVLVYGTINVFDSYMSDISKAFINLGENGRYIEEWINYMNLDEECSDDTCEEIYDSKVVFEHVSFKYPRTEKYVLKDIDITINPGEHIAIVGENGSGKSTFISLIMGMYDDYEGELYVGGISPRINARCIREGISCLFQDFNSYELTIADNVRIGDINSFVTDEQINSALLDVEVEDIVSRSKSGIYTAIGNLHKGISDLSGGQWQKIAIARTLIKSKAKIMILDEPTAALDPGSESKIYKEFLNRQRNRTTILVSHRLGATTQADRILVFDEGRIIEDGTHDELMNLNGKYREMYDAQSEWYK